MPAARLHWISTQINFDLGQALQEKTSDREEAIHNNAIKNNPIKNNDIKNNAIKNNDI